MTGTKWIMAVVLVIGGGSATGAVVIDMPAPPASAETDATQPAGAEPAPTLGQVALYRYARVRSWPTFTSPGFGWGWPLGRRWFGYGYGWPYWNGGWWGPGWGPGWGAWGCGWGWGGWGGVGL